MLSRSSSDAGTRLRRAKSATSVPGRKKSFQLDSISPISRRQALEAARKAYERASGCSEIRTHYGPVPEAPLKRSNATRSSDSTRACVPQESSQSAVQRPFPIPSPSGQADDGTSLQSMPFSLPTAYSDGASRGPNPSDGISKKHGCSGHPIPLGFARHEARKSRSMIQDNTFASSPPVVFGSGDFPGDLLHVRQPLHVDTPPSYSSPLPTAQRGQGEVVSSSGQLVSSSGLHSSPPPDPDQAIAEARDRYLQDIQQQKRVRSKPSFILSFKKYQKQNVLRKAPKPSDAPGPSPSNTNPAGSSDGNEPHIVPKKKIRPSKSIREMVHSFFRKPSIVPPPEEMPVQQIDASRVHYGAVFPLANSQSKRGDRGSPAEDIFRRLRTRATSLGSHGCSRHGSLRSDADLSTVRSRITSWTNTISEENEASAVLSSQPPSTFGESTIFHQPVIPGPEYGASPFHQMSSIVDQNCSVELSPGADLFNALMQRIEPSVPLPDHGKMIGPQPAAHSVRPRQSTSRLAGPRERNLSLTSGFSRLTKATIRTVTPDKYGFFGSRKEHCAAHDLTRSNEAKNPAAQCESINQALKRNEPQYACQTTIPTAEQIAARVEKANERWKSPLSEKSSFVLPRSTGNVKPHPISTLGRSKPFQSFGHEDTSSDDVNQKDLTVDGTETKRGGVSPSVYSRTTGFRSPQPNDSAAVSLCEDDISGNGVATIIQSQTYTYDSPVVKRNGVTSNKSSNDWKAWLSKEVAELENSVTQSTLTVGTDFEKKIAEIEARVTKGTDTTNSVKDIDLTCTTSLLEEATAAISRRESLSLSVAKPSPAARSVQSRKVTRPRHMETSEGWRSDRSLPRLDSRPGSRMNDRFPMIDTGRKASDQSVRILRKRLKSNSPSTQQSLASRDGNNSISTRDGSRSVSNKSTRTESQPGKSPGLAPRPSHELLPSRRALLEAGHRGTHLPISALPFTLRSSSMSPPTPPLESKTDAPEISATDLVLQELQKDMKASQPRHPTRIPLYGASSSCLPGRQTPTSAGRSQTSLTSCATAKTENLARAARSQKTSQGGNRPRSLLDMRARFCPSPNSHRLSTATELLEDATIKKITEGPYAFPGAGTPVRHSHSKKENSPGRYMTTPGSSSRLQERKHERLGNASPSRGSARPSSGQRMAEAFLQSRMARGATESLVFL